MSALPTEAPLATSPAEHGQPVDPLSVPRGMSWGGLHCGIKRRRPDLGLLLAERPVAAAALFTRNRVKAAPVLVSQQQLRANRGWVRAVIVNSGNANCATGPEGIRAARRMAHAVAQTVPCPPEQVLVCSTGVIGVPLPVERIVAAVPRLVESVGGRAADVAAFAEAILTTDTRTKLAVRHFAHGRQEFSVLGCAKGSGMIHPAMATMLAFVVTDAPLRPAALRQALRAVADRTFHTISVDGDTSTNDTVVLLSTGAGTQTELLPGTKAYRGFLDAFEEVCRQLAWAIVTDGEGARRVLQIEVRGCASDRDARRIAETIGTSLLVKTALAGADPNWGRILAAAGRAGVPFELAQVRLWLADVLVFSRGRPVVFNETAVAERMRGRQCSAVLELGHGPGRACLWTSDLTEEYVRINASYRS